MGSITVTTRYSRPSLREELRSELEQGARGITQFEDTLERYAKTRGWTLGVLLANLLLLVIQALHPSRTAGGERFWSLR